MVTNNTKQVCVALYSIFSDYGLPKELVTDKGQCYTATEFKEFCQSRLFKHTLCTTFHHSSNGCTERTIQDIKKILHKCKSEGSNPNLSLLQYRITPRAPGEKCPAELLEHLYINLLPNLQVSVNIANDTDQDFIQQNYLQIKEEHNARLGPKSQTTIQMKLNEGQYVMFVSNPDASHGFTWTHRTVKKLLNNSRSALIQSTLSGKCMMRKRTQITVSSLNPVEFKEYKKQNDSTTLNAMFKAQPRPESLNQTHGHTTPHNTPMRPLGWL